MIKIEHELKITILMLSWLYIVNRYKVQWIAAMLGMNETLAGVTIVALGNAGPDIAGGFAAFGQMNGETSRIVFNSLLRFFQLRNINYVTCFVVAVSLLFRCYLP